MIALDTNLLVYAHRRDSAFHEAARECVRENAEGPNPWAIAWPCLHEFLAIVTHPKIFRAPTPLEQALAQVRAWRESPSLRIIGEDVGYFEVLERTLSAARVVGPKVHDARIAALAIQHGVTVLLSADRDFSRFSEIKVRNPL